MVTAEIAVPERDLSEVRLGPTLVLRARAYPDDTFEGRVAAIAPTATSPAEGSPERTVLVTTHIDNPSMLLKSEMTGNAKIACGNRRLFDVVTRRLQRYIRVEFWSWW